MMNVQLTEFLRTAVASAHFENHPSRFELAQILDKVAITATKALVHDRRRTFEAAISSLQTIYNTADARSEYTVNLTSQNDQEVVQFWLDIVQRVYLVGAMAVREKKWWAVRYIALRDFHVPEFSGYRSWLRHAITMAARAGFFPENRGGVIISMARDVGIRVPPLVDDIPQLLAASETAGEKDVLLDSLCQFDLAWCVVLAAETGEDHSEFYPSCAAFAQHRAQPAIILIATSADVQQQLFGACTAAQIASGLREVLSLAVEESRRYAGWWQGAETDLRVQRFISTNKTPR
jgi:hypothetical protein